MIKKIVLIGGGGHCKSVLDSLLELNTYEEIGIIDKNENIQKIIFGISVIGCDKDLQKFYDAGYQYAFITIGSIGDPSIRIKLFNLIIKIGYEVPSIIDATANISKHSIIGKGVFVGKHSIINAGSHIHNGAIINTGVIIEHDCHIGEFSHIASGAVLGGEVIIGDNTHIGSSATIKQQVHIGSNSIIGMGSVVLKDIQNSTMAYGNPCMEVKKI